MAEEVGLKYACPVCGCPSYLINDPKNIVDWDKRLRRCPRCGSVLKGLGRIYTVYTFNSLACCNC